MLLGSISAFLYYRGTELRTMGFDYLASQSFIGSLLLGLTALKGTTNGISTLVKLKRERGQF